MKNLICFLVLNLVLIGCGKGTVSPVGSDQTFTSYTQAFDQASAAYNVPTVTGNLNIEFGSINAEANEAGQCFPATLTSAAYILISKSQWEQMGGSERTTLIFHELGHCVLNQVHRPDSIMAPSILPGSTMQSDESYYIPELFEDGQGGQVNANHIPEYIGG